MHTRYTKAMKNPKFAKILEAEALVTEVGEMLTEAMHRRKTDKFSLSTEAGIELNVINDILKGEKIDIRDLSSLFSTLGLRLEITTAPLEK